MYIKLTVHWHYLPAVAHIWAHGRWQQRSVLCCPERAHGTRWLVFRHLHRTMSSYVCVIIASAYSEQLRHNNRKRLCPGNTMSPANFMKLFVVSASRNSLLTSFHRSTSWLGVDLCGACRISCRQHTQITRHNSNVTNIRIQDSIPYSDVSTNRSF